MSRYLSFILFIGLACGQSQDLSVDKLIKHLDLAPHPTGGLFFRQTYKSDGVIPQSVLPKDYRGDRNYNTLIYSLLPEGEKLKFHKLHSDEALHFFRDVMCLEVTADRTIEEQGVRGVLLAVGENEIELLPSLFPSSVALYSAIKICIYFFIF